MRTCIQLLFIGFIVIIFAHTSLAQCGVFIDASSISHTTCVGNADGSASLLSSSTFIHYSWNNVTNGQNYGNGVNVTSVNNLDAGLYVVTGTIPFGSCPSTMYSDTFEILDSSSLHITVNLTDTIQCFGDFATINVVASGGPGWYLYQLNYLVLGNWLPFSQQTTYDTAVFTMLPANTYQIDVSDTSFSCNSTANLIITQPSQLFLTMSSNQIICNGGTPSALSASSGVAGTYIWSPTSYLSNPNVQSPSFNSSFTSSTTYFATFTNANGCTATDSVRIIVNPVPTATLTAMPSPACDGDDITLTATPSIPTNFYRFQYRTSGNWINMTNPQMGSTNPIVLSNITTTTRFRVKVRQALGCNTSSWQPNNQGITVPISNVVTQPINHY